jgi:hypothetical protein
MLAESSECVGSAERGLMFSGPDPRGDLLRSNNRYPLGELINVRSMLPCLSEKIRPRFAWSGILELSASIVRVPKNREAIFGRVAQQPKCLTKLWPFRGDRATSTVAGPKQY